jgi:hypothetical protein
METSSIVIGEKALAVLKGISQISQSLTIRSDYLYTKFEASPEEKGKKGANNIIAEYILPENEIQIEKEFGLFDVNEFLGVVSSFDKDNVKLALTGNAIQISDKRKKSTYYTQSTLGMPTKNVSGDKLFESGKVSVGMILSDADLELIKKDLGVLAFNNLKIKVTNEGAVKIVSGNDVTSNDTEISISQEMVSMSEPGFEFKFPNEDIFSLLIPGSYGLVIKSCDYNGKVIKIAKFISKTISGLSYTLVSH